MLKKLGFLLIATGCLMTARADSVTTITINSSASETSNNSGSATQNISANPVWGTAFSGSNWVSFTNTGNPSSSGFIAVPNGTAVTFTDTFNLAGPITAATLMVMADDTASVTLNGTTIFAASGPLGVNCSASAIGCLTSTGAIFTLAQLGPYLQIGSNTISFTVYQEGGSSYGLDYSGTFVDPAPVPEPSTLGLLACGLIGLSLIRRRTVLS